MTSERRAALLASLPPDAGNWLYEYLTVRNACEPIDEADKQKESDND